MSLLTKAEMQFIRDRDIMLEMSPALTALGASKMTWLDFRKRFKQDFYQLYGRYPTEQEIAAAEASFRAYAKKHGYTPPNEPDPHQTSG
ncbi:hypothetical protein [Oscillatoria salina]|uniref:hypothetical protein n=1 Tax=Oscillatoria salina TaxID=331517 RepID=UPI0013BC18CF|nr:hypothetical protein [Oscillatoria salina]NET89732.1 hypothetical protein [Kamptonema sp. SIO1D9]